MKEIKVSLLSRNNFAPYGQIVDLKDLDPATINTGVVKFWKHQVEVEFDGEIEIGVLMVKTCLCHSINGDFNYSSRAEVEALMKGSGSGRVIR